MTMARYRPHSPGGYTLLELVAASALTALVLVPTLGLLRRSSELSRKIETANLMTTLCTSKLEQHLALTAAQFSSGTQTGDFADQGFPDLCFRVTCSEAVADGGRPEELMAITATVWHDRNNNQVQENDEAAVSFSTKVAQIASYQEQAHGT